LIDIEYRHARREHQIVSILQSLTAPSELELIQVSGFLLDEASTQIPSTDGELHEAGQSQAAGARAHLSASFLAEILTRNLPTSVRLVILVVSSPSSVSDAHSEPAAALDLHWIDTFMSCAPYVLALECLPASSGKPSEQGAGMFLSAFYASYARYRS